MQKISELLGRIISIQARGALILQAVQQALKNQLSFEIPLESISCKGISITLKGIDQSARSAIFIKKESLLKEINELQTIKMIRDIR